MSDLPEGWAMTELGEIARWGSGGTPKKGIRGYYGGEIPWANSGDLADGVLNECPASLTRRGLENSSAKLIEDGTLLVAMYGATIGRLAIAGVSMATNQAVAFARPEHGIDLKYLFFYLLSQRNGLRGGGKGAAQKNISQTILKAWPVPVPPVPEQRRIVAAIEEHISRLDAAETDLRAALARTTVLTQATLIASIPCKDAPGDWTLTTVDAAGRTDLGRQRAPKYHDGPSMRPYLRVANVFEDRLDLYDVMEMDIDDNAWTKYRLIYGDILLNEGQSPHLVGRPAMYRGDPEAVAFTNSLIRFQAHDDVDPEWALLVFRRHLHARRFMKEASITTNIAHLALKRFRTVEFPKPPLPEQRRLVAQIQSDLDAIDRMREEIATNLKRVAAARRSILAAAFSGQLVPQDPSDEPAERLLERIAVERATSNSSRKQRSAS